MIGSWKNQPAPSAALLLLILGLTGVEAFPATAPVAGIEPTDILIRTSPFPRVRLVSGSLIHEERLFRGGWRTLSWSPSGQIKPDGPLMGRGEELPPTDEPIACAFGLSVDGQELWDHWRFKSAQETPCEAAGCRHVVVELASAIRPVSVKIHTQIDGSPFLKRWLEIRNDGTAPAAVGSVFPMSGYLFAARRLKENLPRSTPGPFSILRPVSLEAVREADFRWMTLPDGTYSYGANKYGTPFAVVKNAVSGEVFLLHFGWSGQYAFEFHSTNSPTSDTAWLHFRVGLAGPGPFRVLRPGASATTPAVYIGHMLEDLDGAVQALHKYLRGSVLPPTPDGRPRPVEYNSWGYVEHEVTEDALKAAIDVVADIGAELYTIDAGWYGDAGIPWPQRRGDWKTGSRLPNGLDPVYEYARSKGLLCGLWVDIESIGLESELRKQHPDWVVKLHGSSEGQAGLDFTKPEVVRFAEQTLVDLITRYKLDVFRLDYNTHLGRAGVQQPVDGFVENTYWRHLEAVYAMYGRLRKRFPHLMMENCAGGGGRNDLGMLRNFHWAQTSDEWGSVRALKILNGFSLAFPPEWGQNYVGIVSPENYRYGDADFRFRAVMFGHLSMGGIAPNLKELPAAYRARVKHHIQLYKNFIRPVMPTARVYHHTPVVPNTEPGSWVVIEHAAPDGKLGYAGIFRLAAANEGEYRFRPRGVDPARSYKVTFDSAGASVRVTGAALLNEGLVVRLGRPLQSELLLFEAE